MALVTDKQFMILGGVAVVAGVYLAYQGRKVVKQASETLEQVVANDLNPASNDNVVNQVFTDTWRNITGNPNWTLGGWIYDVTHKDPMLAGSTVPGQVITDEY